MGQFPSFPKQNIHHLGLVHIDGVIFYFLHLYLAGRAFLPRLLKARCAPGTDILRPVKQMLSQSGVAYSFLFKSPVSWLPISAAGTEAGVFFCFCAAVKRIKNPISIFPVSYSILWFHQWHPLSWMYIMQIRPTMNGTDTCFPVNVYVFLQKDA